MVRPLPIFHAGDQTFSAIPLAIGLFVSATLMVALCAKHAKQLSRKYQSKTSDSNTGTKSLSSSPLPSPKQLITTISHKAMTPLIHTKKSSSAQDHAAGKEESGGVWQKAILMGEKCQPLEFSGVIYYDYSGNRVPEMPKSPRATSLSPLRNFTFPVRKDHENSSVY